MNECPHLDALIGKLIAGEPDALDPHVNDCPDCSQVLQLVRELSGAGAAVPEPGDDAFRVMRMNVLAQMSREPRSWRTFFEHGWAFLRAQPVGASLLLVALIAGAALGGRWSARLGDDPLVRSMREQAAATSDIDAYWDAPLLYTNVSARPTDDGQLALSFDVVRHVDLIAARDSQVAKDVLLHAILEPSPLGARLKAITLTEEIMDTKLKDAVIFAMRHDPQLAVRLEALEVLARYPFDAAVQDALLTTLKLDESVQMRLLALEHLARRQVSPEALRRSIEAGGLESDRAVWQRAFELDLQL